MLLIGSLCRSLSLSLPPSLSRSLPPCLSVCVSINQALGKWWSVNRQPSRSRHRWCRRRQRQEPKPYRFRGRNDERRPRPRGKRRRRRHQQPGILRPCRSFNLGGVSAADLRAPHPPRNSGLLQRCKLWLLKSVDRSTHTLEHLVRVSLPPRPPSICTQYSSSNPLIFLCVSILFSFLSPN